MTATPSPACRPPPGICRASCGSPRAPRRDCGRSTVSRSFCAQLCGTSSQPRSFTASMMRRRSTHDHAVAGARRRDAHLVEHVHEPPDTDPLAILAPSPVRGVEHVARQRVRDGRRPAGEQRLLLAGTERLPIFDVDREDQRDMRAVREISAARGPAAARNRKRREAVGHRRFPCQGFRARRGRGAKP